VSEPAADIVRALSERYESGGLEALIDLLAPDAVFVVPPEASMEPDVYTGHEGARRYFAGFDGALDEVRFGLDEVDEVAPGTVLAKVRLRGVGAVTRIPVEQSTFMTFRVRDGLITRIAAHADLASAHEEIAGTS
jgi:ketosteroid isomerase-like protein